MATGLRRGLVELVCSVFLMVGAGAASAATLGPTYPAPGESLGDVSSSGASVGIGGGKTFTYSNLIQGTNFDELWWGPANIMMGTTGTAISGPNAFPSLPLVALSLQTYSATVATWTGLVSIPTTVGYLLVNGRFTSTITSGNATWVDAASAGISGIGSPDVVAHLDSGTSLSVNDLFTVNGVAFLDWYAGLGTTYFPGYYKDPNVHTSMNFSGLFYYTEPLANSGDVVTPVPAALPLFVSGLAGLGLLGWRRKRKKAAAIAAV